MCSQENPRATVLQEWYLPASAGGLTYSDINNNYSSLAKETPAGTNTQRLGAMLLVRIPALYRHLCHISSYFFLSKLLNLRDQDSAQQHILPNLINITEDSLLCD